MKKLALLFVPLMIACAGEEQESDVIDADEYLGEIGVLEDSVEVDTTTLIDLGTNLSKLVNGMSSAYDTTVQENFHLLDRFTFSTSQKIKFVGKEEVPYGKSNMVTPKADFFYYTFADTNKTLNAFYNYLDEMAVEGEGGPVKLNEDVEAIKMPPMFMVVYDTVIVSVKYLCEHEENDWNAFQDSILTIYGKEYRYQIDVDCGGPLKWK
jgi:hypothetical protein